MFRYLYILVFLLSLGLYGCDERGEFETGQSRSREELEAEDRIEDGTYFATVDYYNPRTRTNRSYDLEVEVVDNNVANIYFNNGGC